MRRRWRAERVLSFPWTMVKLAADAGRGGAPAPTAVLTVVALFCAGCGSSSSHSVPTPATNAVTALGATSAEWGSTHTADRQFAPGSVYDADSRAPNGALYSAVVHQDGHVLQYDYSFADRPVAKAQARVLESQFPPGAKVVWFVSKPTCAQMLVKSATLARQLGVKSVGDRTGTALVELLSGATDTSYDPTSVNEASLQSFPLIRPSHSPNC
jgi:hypothetical protein